MLSERDWKIDVVLSHTCPLRYEPTEVFLSMIDQSSVDKSIFQCEEYSFSEACPYQDKQKNLIGMSTC